VERSNKVREAIFIVVGMRIPAREAGASEYPREGGGEDGDEDQRAENDEEDERRGAGEGMRGVVCY
jgi:hypothetical protein